MIQTQNLTKKYGRTVAVNRLNLTVRQGTVFGLIGENGAGKTTTLSMLATLTVPTFGRAFVNGFEVCKHPHDVRMSIGYMPDAFGVYDDLTVTEYLYFYAECYGIKGALARRRSVDLLEWVNLQNQRKTYVNALSRGMQQRLELARCLMHDPQVLILDEPASGLDPRSRIELRRVLRRLRELGKTMIISSHILNELSEVSDEIGMMRGGELSAVAAVDALLDQTGAYRRLWIQAAAEPESWHRVLANVPQVLEYALRPQGVEMVFSGLEEEQAELLKRLIQSGIAVTHFGEQPTDIESLFLRLTERGVLPHDAG
ncbi:ABC transporter ATP-binding protein [Alicyclobacillaceae bacterium I2511]|nr:ABC transporter ATP-binding protein [Alicyclobacillaceae bacterium I2511]